MLNCANFYQLVIEGVDHYDPFATPPEIMQILKKAWIFLIQMKFVLTDNSVNHK